jgi:beta-phosphoglucomutase-like phosphatase (HAD superfamily)
MPSIRAIALDLDGVLVDAGVWHKDALNAALLEFGYRKISEDEHRNEFDGLPTKDKLNKLVSRGRLKPQDIQAIAHRKQEITTEYIAQRTEFDADKFCLFCGLRMMDYKIAVVSNSIRKTVTTVLDLLHVTILIDEIICNEDGRPKPAPDLYKKALDRMNVTAAETLVVEDGHYGEQAARAAGITNIFKVRSANEVHPTSIFKALYDANINSNGGEW